ncbi:MAG: hypothetical protein A2X94_17195 [Bdellovibrionales bacterium GWB1_55_8]|nr:MAG: hypothetical protein A2X94_17195 [Bdellovibrionales bacterium GWB1_55_8]
MLFPVDFLPMEEVLVDFFKPARDLGDEMFLTTSRLMRSPLFLVLDLAEVFLAPPRRFFWVLRF